MAGSRRARTSEGPRGTAKDRALRLLGVRSRSREELRIRLTRAGFEPDDVERALDDLESVGLIDDERFARDVVRDRAGRSLMADRAIAQELLRKGVARDAVDLALEDVADEEARALELARRQAARLRGVPDEAAYRRIFGLLQRRGFGSSIAVEATRAALSDRAGDGDGDEGHGGALV